MCKILNSKYNSFQKKIDEEKEKTGENTADFKQREKELKENLVKAVNHDLKVDELALLHQIVVLLFQDTGTYF